MPNSDRLGTVDSAQEFITRRKMLAASSAMVASGLAGCMGGEEDDGSDGNGDGNGGGRSAIRTWQPTIPNEINFNTFASGYPWSQSWMILEPVLKFFTDGSIELEMVDDWEYDDEEQSVTVEFNDEWYWWNGDQITAEDKYWYEKCAFHIQGEGSDLEDIELVDEQTLVRYYKEPQNPQLVEYQLGGYLGAMQRSHRDKFRPWAEELEDASGDEAITEIQERMGEEMPLHISTVAEEGLGNGPFQITDFDQQGIYFEKFDQHPYADQINIDEFEFILAKEDAVASRIQGGDVDFGFGLTKQWVGEGASPDHIEDVIVYDDTFMRRLEFMGQGPGADHLRKRAVRRAIAHVVDCNHVSNNYDNESIPREAQTGLTNDVTASRLDDNYVGDYLDYPVETDEDGAVELLEGAGYERDGDEWVDENGDTVGFELVVPNYITNPGRTVSDQLANFGFEIEFNALESATYNARTEDAIDFDMTVGSHGGTIAHPWFYFRTNHSHSLELGDGAVIEQTLEDGGTRSPYNGREIVVEIPTEVGESDLSGSTEEINLYELDKEWRNTQTDERNQEIVETFSWYWNFHLPGVDLLELQSGTYGNTRDFEFDTDTKDWEAYRGAYRGLKRGHVSSR